MSLYKSTHFSVKMILKNKQRTLTMALGIMIAIALVIGVLGYIDYSQNEVISRAVQDIPIDMTVFQNTPDSSQVSGFTSYLSSYGSFVTNSEFIQGTLPASPNNPGVAVPTNTTETNTSSTDGGGFINLLRGQVMLVGINMSYFNTFSDIFSINQGSASSLTNSTVFISQTYSDQSGYTQGSSVNITLQSINIDFQTRSASVSMLNQDFFNVSGIVTINSAIFQKSIDSFNPQTSSSNTNTFANRFQRLTDSVIFMDLNTYNKFVSPSNTISFSAFQIRLDHSQLSPDTSLIGAQLAKLENYIELKYTQVNIVSDLQNAINAQASQLDNLRLTLVYLTLPSIFIGFMLTKYATDLVLLERKKEITALRAKSLSQTQIRDYVVIESLITALIGTVLGIFLGFGTSFILNNASSNYSNAKLVVSQDSIILALILGIGLAAISGLYTANKIMNQSIIEGLRIGKSDGKPFWIKYYIDIVLLGIGVLFSVFSIIDFNPIPGFAAAAFDLLVPITTWVGAALFLVRVLEITIVKIEPIISKILGLVIGDIGSVVTKGIVRKPDKFNQLTIILILVLSFGIVVGSVSTTYQAKASTDATFSVGSDFRIDLPGTDQLSYNTSDFLSALQSNISDVSFTPVIVTTIPVGLQRFPVIGIDTNTFLSGAYFQDSFLQSGNSSLNAMKYLQYDPANPKIIISNAVANPVTGNRIGQGRFARFQNQDTQQFANFAVGSTIPARFDGQFVNFTITDISYYFPALANVLNQPADNLRYAVTDYRTLTEPLNGVNQTLETNGNSTFLLGTYTGSNNNFNATLISQQINKVYSTYFPNSYPIVINTQAQYLADSTSIGGLLINLANLELVIVLVVTMFTLGIYTTTTLLSRKKIFGTFNALGAKLKSIWYIVTGEMLIGILYSMVISLVLGLIVSYTYLGFISNLFILPYISLTLSPIYSFMIYALAVVGLIAISGYAVQRIFRLEPVEALREL